LITIWHQVWDEIDFMEHIHAQESLQNRALSLDFVVSRY